MSKIIALGYKKSRGKDSVCNFMKDWLHREHPELKVRKVGFADKLKDIAHQLYGWADLQPGIYYEERYKEKEVVLPKIGLTPRQIWIGLGNSIRDLYEPTWIDYITKGGIKCDVLLIKDMGFTTEATSVRESGGWLLNVERDGPMADDPRETELDSWTDWDGVLSNHGSLEDLHDVVVKQCERMWPA